MHLTFQSAELMQLLFIFYLLSTVCKHWQHKFELLNNGYLLSWKKLPQSVSNSILTIGQLNRQHGHINILLMISLEVLGAYYRSQKVVHEHEGLSGQYLSAFKYSSGSSRYLGHSALLPKMITLKLGTNLDYKSQECIHLMNWVE